jgi:hypothetical protein
MFHHFQFVFITFIFFTSLIYWKIKEYKGKQPRFCQVIFLDSVGIIYIFLDLFDKLYVCAIYYFCVCIYIHISYLMSCIQVKVHVKMCVGFECHNPKNGFRFLYVMGLCYL